MWDYQIPWGSFQISHSVRKVDYVRLLDPLEYFVLQGVPIRIEVGPRDMKTQQVVTVRRDTGTKECIQVASDVGKSLGEMLKSMQKEMFQRQLYP